MADDPNQTGAADRARINPDEPYEVRSPGNALATAGKVVLGAVLHAGDAIRASINGENDAPPTSAPGKKRRHMKRKKNFPTPP